MAIIGITNKTVNIETFVNLRIARALFWW